MKKIISSILFVVVAISSTGFISSSKNSGGIAGYTGSSGEGICNSCHSGGTSISSGVSITSTPIFTANQYVPGTTYTITIGIGAAGFTNFGFGAEILSSTNTNIGIMQNPGTGVQFLNAGNGRKNATQTTPKNGANNSVNFTFEWVAPLSGAATIYVSGNAVNLTGGTGGDFANISSSLALTAAPTNGVQENTNVLVSEINISPNPVSDIMSVSYLLTKSQNISIQLIDINGKVIKQLTNQNQTAGIHTSTNNIGEVTKGVYFVKVLSDNQKVAQKLIVVN